MTAPSGDWTIQINNRTELVGHEVIYSVIHVKNRKACETILRNIYPDIYKTRKK